MCLVVCRVALLCCFVCDVMCGAVFCCAVLCRTTNICIHYAYKHLLFSTFCMYIITYMHNFRVFKCAQCLLSFSGGFLLSFFFLLFYLFTCHVCARSRFPPCSVRAVCFSVIFIFIFYVSRACCVSARAALHACVSALLDVRPRACCLAAELARPSLLTLISPSPSPSPPVRACVRACVCECVRV